MQYMIQQFCRQLKFDFTGNRNDSDSFEFDIEETCPVLKQYCKDDIKEELENNLQLSGQNAKNNFKLNTLKIKQLHNC